MVIISPWPQSWLFLGVRTLRGGGAWLTIHETELIPCFLVDLFNSSTTTSLMNIFPIAWHGVNNTHRKGVELCACCGRSLLLKTRITRWAPTIVGNGVAGPLSMGPLIMGQLGYDPCKWSYGPLLMTGRGPHLVYTGTYCCGPLITMAVYVKIWLLYNRGIPSKNPQVLCAITLEETKTSTKHPHTWKEHVLPRV